MLPWKLLQASSTIQFHKKEDRWRPSVDLQIFCHHFLTFISPYYFITKALYCWKNRNDVTEFESINYQIYLSKF